MSPIFYVAFGALWVTVLALGVLVLLLYRHFGMMSMETFEGVQRDGLSVGSKPPEFSGLGAMGDGVEWSPTHGRSSLLLFITPECGPCQEILPVVNEVARHAASHALPLDVIAITSGDGVAVRQLAELQGLHFPLVRSISGDDIPEAFAVRHTPFAMVVGPEGRIRSKGLCNDRTKLRRVLEDGETSAAQLLGEPAFNGLAVDRSGVTA